MDLNRIVRMLVGMFAFKALRSLSRKVGGAGPARSGPATRTGGGAAKAGGAKPGPATPQDAQARAARETAKRARKAAQLTRRLGR